MTLKNYHLVPDGSGKWKLEQEHAERASKVFDNKEEAVKQSVAFAKAQGDVSLKIHGQDGKIQEERTYPRSADPRRSPG